MKMAIVLMIILCAALWTNVNAYRKEIMSTRVKHCNAGFRGGVHEFKGFVLEGEKGRQIVGPIERLHSGRECVTTGIAHVRPDKNGEVFVAAEWNETSRLCSAYVSAMTATRTIKPTIPGEDVTLIVAAEIKKCGKVLNPCLPSNAVCTDLTQTTFSCHCDTPCSKYDVPENFKCPQFYMNFEETAKCNIDPPGLNSTGRFGKGLLLADRESAKLGPFPACTLFPLSLGCNSTGFSLSFWLKVKSSGYTKFFVVTHDTETGNYPGFKSSQQDSKFHFSMRDPNTKKFMSLEMSAPDPEIWTHFVVMCNSSHINGFINATRVDVDNSVPVLDNNIRHTDKLAMYFGKTNNVGSATGNFELDEIYILPEIIEQTDINLFE